MCDTLWSKTLWQTDFQSDKKFPSPRLPSDCWQISFKSDSFSNPIFRVDCLHCFLQVSKWMIWRVATAALDALHAMSFPLCEQLFSTSVSSITLQLPTLFCKNCNLFDLWPFREQKSFPVSVTSLKSHLTSTPSVSVSNTWSAATVGPPQHSSPSLLKAMSSHHN